MNTRGIGLGLVISKDIAEQFGGSIGFISQWGKGSTFSFRMNLENDLVDMQPEEFKFISPEEELLQLQEDAGTRVLKKMDFQEEVKEEEKEGEESDETMLDNFSQNDTPMDNWGNPQLPQNILKHLSNVSEKKEINYMMSVD